MWGWFGGAGGKKKNDPKDAIIKLRQQLEMLQKRERHLEMQVAEQDAAARKNVATNKTIAKAALTRKKNHEASLRTTQAQVQTVEQQIYAIESAKINSETLRVMKDANKAMQGIHGGMNIDKVEETMDSIRDQVALSQEIGEAITRVSLGAEIDDDELLEELESMEQEVLDKKMLAAPGVPVSQVGNGAIKGKAPVQASKEEEDEEEELRKLQAEMSM